MSTAVQEILRRIEALSETEKLELQAELTRHEEREWAELSADARQRAGAQGHDDAAIARAVESLRYGNASEPK